MRFGIRSISAIEDEALGRGKSGDVVVERY
jgi:hypothetical protein